MVFRFGWVKDERDHRDQSYSLELLQPIQDVFLSRTYRMPDAYNQGNLGSCTGNGVAFLVQFALLNKHYQTQATPFIPSRLFIYYWERFMEGTVMYDAGAQIRDGIKVVATMGVPPETLWDYNVDKFNVRPSDESIASALKFQAITYQAIDNGNKQLIVNTLLEGYPVVFGMRVYASFMEAHAGIIPMPGYKEKILGGHCMVIVGYSVKYDAFIVRNSWGTDWGQNGYCRIPAGYLCNTDLANDFWIIKSLE